MFTFNKKFINESQEKNVFLFNYRHIFKVTYGRWFEAFFLVATLQHCLGFEQTDPTVSPPANPPQDDPAFEIPEENYLQL